MAKEMLHGLIYTLLTLLILFVQVALSFHQIDSHVETIQGTGFHRVKNIHIPNAHSKPSSSLIFYFVYQSFPSDFFIDRYQIERMYKKPSLQKNVTLLSLWTSDPSLDLEKSQLGSHAFETLLIFQLSPHAMSIPTLTLTLPFHLRYPRLRSERYTETLLDEASLMYTDHWAAHAHAHAHAHALSYIQQTNGEMKKKKKKKQIKVDQIPVGQPADRQTVDWILFSVIWLGSLYLAFKVYYYQLKYQEHDRNTQPS